MKYIIQCFWILFFYLLGVGISFLMGGFIPGSVVGMVLLFAALALGWIKPRQVENVAQFLIRYMVLFFLPAAVGVMTAWEMISQNAAAIATATLISTVAIIAVVGVVQQKMERRHDS